MGLVIPRGIVYHRVIDDVFALIKATYSPLDDSNSIEAFENKFATYIGSNHCVAFPYARTAIYYTLKLQDYKPGDEIIMPPITIKAILDVVLELKLTPVFVDINPDTLCFDFEKLKSAIGPNTKSILITYLFGMVANLDELISYCKKNSLFIIEDFSQCLNGKYKNKKTGSFGDVGIYSSSSIKTLDTYGGGLLISENEQLINKLRTHQAELEPTGRLQLISKIIIDLIRNMATTRLIFHTLVFPLLKFLSFIRPETTIKHTGERGKTMITSLPQEWFTKYSSFQANEGMKIIDGIEKTDRQRIWNVDHIKSSATQVNFPKGVAHAENVYWQLVAYFDHPTLIQKRLHSKKIDTSTTSLEYISNLPSYPYKGDTPNADKLYNNGLFIPAYPGLSDADLDHLVHTLNEIDSELG